MNKRKVREKNIEKSKSKNEYFGLWITAEKNEWDLNQRI